MCATFTHLFHVYQDSRRCEMNIQFVCEITTTQIFLLDIFLFSICVCIKCQKRSLVPSFRLIDYWFSLGNNFAAAYQNYLRSFPLSLLFSLSFRKTLTHNFSIVYFSRAYFRSLRIEFDGQFLNDQDNIFGWNQVRLFSPFFRSRLFTLIQYLISSSGESTMRLALREMKELLICSVRPKLGQDK